ncbi:MAG: M20/M25/M40 family metallo-hydrolase, partial [Phenylobacterium sp.]
SVPKTLVLAAALALVAAAAALAAPPKVDPALHDQALELLKKGIAFRTVTPGDQVAPYAAYLKDVLVKAGYRPEDVKIEAVAGSATLTARYPGADPKKKPIIVIDHMDVVEAKAADWTRDPFTPVVENGYVYGRGSYDDKFDVSIVVTVLSKLKRAGWKPGRDVILALSGDEETAGRTAAHLAQQLKGAEMVLNGDGGGGLLSEDGKPVVYALEGAEKTYADFSVTVTNPGGHSSRPGKTNAIYQLAQDLDRLAAYQFPPMRNEFTDAFFKASAPNTAGPAGEAMKRYVANPGDAEAVAALSALPEYVGQLRTTCVATQISGGHAPNALPQKVTANINCRIFPGTPTEAVRQTLVKVLADPEAKVVPSEDNPGVDAGPSPLRPDVLAAVTKAVHASHPGVPIVPSMAAGASDSIFYRAQGMPAYNLGGLFMKSSDDFAHGLNERAPLAAIDADLVHWESLLRDLAK